MTGKEIKELWELCGFKKIYPIQWSYSGCWAYPNGEFEAKLPELTLDNLFKYAVPKVIDKNCGFSLHYDIFNKEYEVEIYGVNLGFSIDITRRDKDLAEALAQAILQVLRGGK